MKAKFPEIDTFDGRSAYDPDGQRNFARDGDTWIDTKTGEVICPVKQSNGGWSGWGSFLWTCMKAKFPEIDTVDGRSAYDPDGQRNFARDGDTWIDTKTGEVICPKLKPSTVQQPTPPTGSQVGSVPPVKLDPSEQRILSIHNAERAAVGAEPLRWNPQLAAGATAYAQELARTGQRVHATREGREDVRENLNQGMLGWNTDQMLGNWLDEKGRFTAGTFPDVCAGGWTKCGHYSQMIWPETTDLGCGMASGRGFKWLVCRYSPGGNKDGQVVGTPVRYRWVDVKTGEPVRTLPIVPGPGDYKFGSSHIVLPNPDDPNRAYDPETGSNFAREGGAWIDVKTGEPVRTLPIVPGPGDYKFGSSHIVLPNPDDPNRAYDPETGRNFAREPVPAPVKGKN